MNLFLSCVYCSGKGVLLFRGFMWTFPAGSAHDAHKLAPFDVEINAFEHMQRLSAAVSLVYVFKMYHILMQTSTLPPRSSAVVR